MGHVFQIISQLWKSSFSVCASIKVCYVKRKEYTMDSIKSKRYDDLDIKVPIGNMIINILNLSYEAPRPGWYYRNHTHSGYELHFIPQGNGILKVFDKSHDITPGIFYLTGPGVYHEQRADDFNPMSEYCINFEIKIIKESDQRNNTYITSVINSIINTLKGTSFWFGSDKLMSIDIFEKMMKELDNSLIGCYTYVQSFAMQIIVNAVRCISLENKSNYFLPHKIPSDSRRAFVDCYFTDCDRPLCREELADRIGVTVRQLNRIMHQYYFMSFSEKLIITRLEGAKNLLLNPELSLNYIAEHIGFSSLSYFSKVFIKHYNISVNKFRKG